MVKRVLLDTNLLIAALDEDGDTTTEKREQAKELLEELLSDDDVSFAITPLIRYEVLRGADWGDTERYQKLRDALNAFEEFDISRKIAELATGLYRTDMHQTPQAQKQERNIDKHNFDVFHYATAKCLQIEVKSHDRDFSKLDKLMQDYQRQLGIL